MLKKLKYYVADKFSDPKPELDPETLIYLQKVDNLKIHAQKMTECVESYWAYPPKEATKVN